MNKLILFLFMLMGTHGVFSQKVYFVYLQTEQQQPFFVRMDEKVYSSTASGYLILSNLRDSSYQFRIGFPQGKWPEQEFTVALKGRDQGFLLKHFGDKGWGLFNLQTLGVQMSATTEKDASFRTREKEVTPFTDILAKAADDPSLRVEAIVVNEKKPVASPEKEEVTSGAQPAVVLTRASAVPAEPVPAKPAPGEPERQAVEEKAPAVEIVKTPEKTSPDPGAGQLQPVKGEEKGSVGEKIGGSADTVAASGEIGAGEAQASATKPVQVTEVTLGRIGEEPAPGNRNEKQTADAGALDMKSPVRVRALEDKQELGGTHRVYIDEQADGTRDTIGILIPAEAEPVVEIKEVPKEDLRFLNISSDTARAPAPQSTSPVLATDTRSVRKECMALADESDFYKLRKKMVAETDDDDMVDEARKYFRTKCFSTQQIRNLGVLFLDDLGRYKFFDMAYIFASDPVQYAVLEAELKDEYYKKRFRAMLK